MLVPCMNLKKIGKLFTSKFVGTGPSSYKKKKNLPDRGLTKVEKHWCRSTTLQRWLWTTFSEKRWHVSL